LGGGGLGYLGITVEPAIYTTLSATPFDIPPNPGATPVFPAGATGPVIANIRVVFSEETANFNQYIAVSNALAAQIIEAIDPMYLAGLRVPYIGLGTRTPRDLLAHLYRNYAKITAADLDANDVAMKQPCDVNQPIEVLFKQIEDAIEFAAAGASPYTPAQILNIAYQLIFRTGIFADDCKLWKRQGPQYKTWPQFKIDFTLAYQEYSESLEISPQAAGFHAAQISDYQESTVDAIAHLATATAADRTSVANMTATVALLTKDLAESNKKLIAALHQVNNLTKQLASKTPGNPDHAKEQRKHYCWSCGYKSDHGSFKCTCPKTGHKKYAKAADTQGGSTANKPE
jgi:hypothetical protein